ncbi:uncharacterized protein G2W53_032087 [Senna tora]|uniref:Uncharacterized protein n=1 Tax=Senna tora TaxID=362788 RepID=A0A834SYB7_9FABA|nr:uncharacterized protein G2W53_032087 [Senna tora]
MNMEPPSNTWPPAPPSSSSAPPLSAPRRPLVPPRAGAARGGYQEHLILWLRTAAGEISLHHRLHIRDCRRRRVGRRAKPP